MNLWKSLLLADLHRTRYFFVCLLALRILDLILDLRIPSAPDELLVFVSRSLPFVVQLLIMGCVFFNLWQDSPTRRDNHLSTRPVRPLSIAISKFLAYVIIVVVPAIGFESLKLALGGYPARTISLVALQSILTQPIAFLPLLGLAWFWRSWKTAVPGTLLCAGALFIIIQPGFSRSRTPSEMAVFWIYTIPLSRAMAFAIAAIFILIALGFNQRFKLYPWLKCLLAPALLYAGFYAVILIYPLGLVPNLGHSRFAPDKNLPTKILPAPSIINASITQSGKGSNATTFSTSSRTTQSFDPTKKSIGI